MLPFPRLLFRRMPCTHPARSGHLAACGGGDDDAHWGTLHTTLPPLQANERSHAHPCFCQIGGVFLTLACRH
jgi:hypothetical protein